MHRVDMKDTKNRTFPAILAEQAKQNPHGEFLITDSRRLNFIEVEEQTNKLAGGLRDLGVVAGERVALMLSNDIEIVLLALAINKLGAAWTPINAEYKGDWLLDNVLRCRCTVLVVDEALQSRIVAIQDQLGDEKIVLVGDSESSDLAQAISYQSLLAYDEINVDLSTIDYGDTCSILWTSGTTGKSKGSCKAITAGYALSFTVRASNMIRLKVMLSTIPYRCIILRPGLPASTVH